jgi:SAM-dependent methyltransferase
MGSPEHGTSHPQAIWDEVEHGSYAADLPLWEELAAAGGPVLDVGCGSGRVALHLARRGHEVWALDRDPELIGALDARASAKGLDVHAVEADARDFRLDSAFGLIVAPMQLVQLLRGESGRAGFLRRAAEHLSLDGVVATALVEAAETGEEGGAALPDPDVRERDGWVYSSQPLAVRAEGTALVIERLRQTVSPAGGLTDELHRTRLDLVSPDELESEAGAAGLVPLGRRHIPPTPDHVGSTVVLLALRRDPPHARFLRRGVR